MKIREGNLPYKQTETEYFWRLESSEIFNRPSARSVHLQKFLILISAAQNPTESHILSYV